ncbi:MAG: hypothetical protein R2705_07600 [Ilumatobacteraceae bacterium]
MSANLRQYISAVYAFEHVLKMAKPTAFTRKAPCAGWTGKDVYEHGIGNLAMIKSFATTGKGPKRTPKLGADPVGAWVKLRDQTLEALDHAHVLQTVVHDPFGPDFGPMPMDDLVGFMAADLAPTRGIWPGRPRWTSASIRRSSSTPWRSGSRCRRTCCGCRG